MSEYGQTVRMRGVPGGGEGWNRPGRCTQGGDWLRVLDHSCLYPRCGVAYVDSIGNRRVSFRYSRALPFALPVSFLPGEKTRAGGRVTLAPAYSRAIHARSCAFRARFGIRAAFRGISRPIALTPRLDTHTHTHTHTHRERVPINRTLCTFVCKRNRYRATGEIAGVH